MKMPEPNRPEAGGEQRGGQGKQRRRSERGSSGHRVEQMGSAGQSMLLPPSLEEMVEADDEVRGARGTGLDAAWT